LRSDGYQIIDHSRPRSKPATNYGGAAIISVPAGVRLSAITLGVNPTSQELLCARIMTGSSLFIVVLIYRDVTYDVIPHNLIHQRNTSQRRVSRAPTVAQAGCPSATRGSVGVTAVSAGQLDRLNQLGDLYNNEITSLLS